MEVDFYDSKALMRLADENISVAQKYREARENYGKNKCFLDHQLAKAFLDPEFDGRMAYDKALIWLVKDSTACKIAHRNMVQCEQVYKGLEKVIEINQAKISLFQSLIKNQIKNT